MSDEVADETEACDEPSELAHDDTVDATELADAVRARTPRASTETGWPPPPPEKTTEPPRHAREFNAETPDTFDVRFRKPR